MPAKSIIITLLLLIITPYSAFAQANPDSKVAIPPNLDEPTQVSIDIDITQILSINERDETFEVDAFLYTEWQDPRLAFDADVFGAEIKTYHNELAQEKLKSEIWAPGFSILNTRGPRQLVDLAVWVYDDGTVCDCRF